MTDDDPHTPRPMGQLSVDAQKNRIIDHAEKNGWVAESRDPLTLSRGDKQIMVKFNGAGMPNGAFWMKGDEFASMGASGYLSLDTLTAWIESGHGRQEHDDEETNDA